MNTAAPVNVLDPPIISLGRKSLKTIRELMKVFCVASGDDLLPSAACRWTVDQTSAMSAA